MAATVFSTQLQKLRKAKGVKQEQLAERLGVSTQAVSKWENGSYPDGDLLPQIAKFFDVSIDYLYGNEQETMRIDERVVEYIDKETDAGGNRLEKLLELQWMGMGNGTVPHMENEQGMVTKGYLPLPKITKEEGQTGSGYISYDGASFMRLNEDLRYGFVMERPENGYEAYVADTEELAQVFTLLSDADAIKTLLFMMTLDATELVRAETVAKYLDISVEKVEHVLEKAASLGKGVLFGGGANGLICRSALLKEDGTEETLYTEQQYVIIAMLRLLIMAKDILHPIHSYRNLSVNISGPLLNRNHLLDILNRQKTGKEEHHE